MTAEFLLISWASLAASIADVPELVDEVLLSPRLSATITVEDGYVLDIGVGNLLVQLDTLE